MQLLILANKDIASCYALNMLLPRLTEHHQVHLWVSQKVGNQRMSPAPLTNLKFFEQDILNRIIDPLLVPSKTGAFSGFTGLSKYLSSSLIEENNINSSEAINRVKELTPDLIISIRYGCILKAGLIQVPTAGVLNLHSGILPKYRGVMATFWAMLNNEKEIGTTLHTIDDGTIDTGKIIKISRHPMASSKSYLELVLSLYKKGVEDILEAVATLERGEEINTTPQPDSDNYYSFPGVDDLAAFENQGHRLVDESKFIDFVEQHFV